MKRRKLPGPDKSDSARLREGPTGKSSDAQAGIIFDYKVWFKRSYEPWLQLLRRHFYDSQEGYLGPEGDPIRLPSPTPSAANFALAADSRMPTDSELTYDGSPAAAPDARASAMPVQLRLL